MKKITWITIIAIITIVTMSTFSVGYKIGYSIFENFVPKATNNI